MTTTETTPDDMPRRTAELLVALVCLVIGASIAYGASQIEVSVGGDAMGPREWPIAMGIGIAALSALLLLRAALLQSGVTETENQLPVNRLGATRLFGALVLLSAYVATWELLPFAVATPVLVAAMLLLNGEHRWRVVLLVTVSIAAVLIGLFQFLLRVPL